MKKNIPILKLKNDLSSEVESIGQDYIICKDFIVYKEDEYLIDEFINCDKFENVIEEYWK